MSDQPTSVPTTEAVAPPVDQNVPPETPQTEASAEPAKPQRNVDELVRGSHRKFEEAARMRKEADQVRAEAQTILTRLESDPAFLDERPDLAKKLEDYFVSKLAKEYELSELDPKDRELSELKSKEAKRQAEEAKAKQASELERANAMAVRYAEKIETEMVQALSGSNLPKTPRTIRLMAQKMEDALDIGYEPSYEELVEEVRAEYDKDRSLMVSEWDTDPDDVLLERLGHERARRISKAYVAHLKKAKTGVTPGVPAPKSALDALKAKSSLKVDDLSNLTDAERFKILHG